MTDPTADQAAEFTRTQAPADTADETGNGTGTLDSAFDISRPSAHITRIEVGQRLDDFDLLVELGSGAFARDF